MGIHGAAGGRLIVVGTQTDICQGICMSGARSRISHEQSLIGSF